jgi:DNA-binding Lrp family transcriptional regulator
LAAGLQISENQFSFVGKDENRFQMELDDRDRQLLKLLQQDSRIANADLAERTGMSTSSCWRRIKAFEEAGIIETYAAVVRPEKLGLSFQAIVHVQLTRHNPEEVEGFIRAVKRREEIRDCDATTGAADYHLRVACADIAAFNRFLEDFLFRQPAVRSAQTNVVLKHVKRA